MLCVGSATGAMLELNKDICNVLTDHMLPSPAKSSMPMAYSILVLAETASVGWSTCAAFQSALLHKCPTGSARHLISHITGTNSTDQPALSFTISSTGSACLQIMHLLGF